MIRVLCPEAFKQAKDGVLIVDDIPTWRMLVSYLYTACLPSEPRLRDPTLATVCHKYKIDGLLQECRRAVKDSISVANFAELKKLAVEQLEIYPDLKEQLAIFCSTLNKEDIIKLLF